MALAAVLLRLARGGDPRLWVVAGLAGVAVASAVAAAYRALSPQERRTAGVFAQNYGEAAAIDVLADGEGLPPRPRGTTPTGSGGRPGRPIR